MRGGGVADAGLGSEICSVWSILCEVIFVVWDGNFCQTAAVCFQLKWLQKSCGMVDVICIRASSLVPDRAKSS